MHTIHCTNNPTNETLILLPGISGPFSHESLSHLNKHDMRTIHCNYNPTDKTCLQLMDYLTDIGSSFLFFVASKDKRSGSCCFFLCKMWKTNRLSDRVGKNSFKVT